MKVVNIGIVGFGTVGAGVADNVIKNGAIIAQRSGVQLVVKQVADLDITSDRGVVLADGVLTTDVQALLTNPEIDIVIELVGGTTFAKMVVETALKNKKSVVTANKALLAEQLPAFSKLAKENGVDLYYEASVGGGIPCIKTLKEGLASNQVTTAMGILNGTCNYIFTRMENEAITFNEILPQAQAAGYAEAEPSLDVDGFDTAHKAVIIASLMTSTAYKQEQLYIEGIREIQLKDVQIANQLGYRLKLLAIIKQLGEELSICVQPTMIPTNSLLGSVRDVFNAAWFHGDTVDDVMMYGRGAGREATASAVVADVIDIALNLKYGCLGRISALELSDQPTPALAQEKNVANFYLRIAKDNIQALDTFGLTVISSEEIDSDVVLFVKSLDYSKLAQMKAAISELVAIRYENL
ncbi:MAG: homoserine dehydrogenase [Lentisphaeria bacterium]|nr:homoserine dehydrogenase [Lentisphaeria bacterium]